MRIGIIGLGTIAKKAYLPVLTEKEGIELVLCTRNADTLQALSKKYRIPETVQTVDELVTKNIDAAFISTPAETHFNIAQKLLQNGIHVYIDKPVSFHFDETKEIAKLAKDVGKIAMVGFNRRFIPRVRELKEKGKPEFIIMQKNRFDLPGETRQFVVEDFIHVVDTLRFLMDDNIEDLNVRYLKKNGKLVHLVVTLIGEDCTAIGIMNRNSGTTEEIIEYTANKHKYVVNNLVETTRYHDQDIHMTKFGDWVPTLYKRGFYQIVDHFIDAVKHNRTPDPSMEDSAMTHEICETIAQQIERGK